MRALSEAPPMDAMEMAFACTEPTKYSWRGEIDTRVDSLAEERGQRARVPGAAARKHLMPFQGIDSLRENFGRDLCVYAYSMH